MNHEQRLLDTLDAVRARHRRLVLWAATVAVCSSLAGVGAAALVRGSGFDGVWVPAAAVGFGATAVVSVLAAGWSLRRWADRLALCRRIERRFPALDARLLALVEPPPAEEGAGAAPGSAGRPAAASARPGGYFRHALVGQVLEHDRTRPWAAGLIPDGRLRAAGVAGGASAAALLIVAGLLAAEFRRRPDLIATLIRGAQPPAAAPDFDLHVEPEDASVERGAGLLVLARFGDRLPADVQLLVRGPGGDARPADAPGTRPAAPTAAANPATRPLAPPAQPPADLRMTKSLDDPVFASRIPAVEADLTYAVRYGDRQTRWYKVGVYEHPELKQADAKLTFPTYTKLPEKVVEDTLSVTAVEGTKAAFTFRLNKPVVKAALVPAPPRPRAAASADRADAPAELPAGPAAPPPPVALTADPADPSVYHAAIDLKQSATYRLELADEAGRGSKRPAELAVTVTANRPPDLKLDFPAKDVDVSPIEELSVRAKVWDDFGLRRVGLSFAMAGRSPQDVVLAEDVPGKDRKDVGYTVALEKLAAEPDQLLSYYFWAEDVAADGSVRRTSGDMFFAEVRPFEEIFRQGEQPSADEQEQQQQNPQGGQNAREAEEAAESQKQIVAATWKVARREAAAAPSAQFAPDVKLIAESQAAAKEKASGLAQKLTDERSKAFLTNVLKHMDAAVAALEAAVAAVPATKPSGTDADANGKLAGDRLGAALAAEQAAYQELLKLRAREHEVVRGNRQQRGQQSASSASSRRQRQLDQLKLADEQNRYEQQRSAAAQQPQQDAQQRETRQVLSRLRELAQRQEDLNRQMKELQSALAEAKEQAQKEEIQRRLARLRDQQREQLRDTDALQDRMEQPDNQERMADARQQLGQTRDDVRKASESLEQGKVQEASAAGARAGEKLDKLREDFRRAAAGQFNDAMDRMRQDARELDQRQQDVSQRLTEMGGTRPSAGRPAATGQPSGDKPQSGGAVGRNPAASGQTASEGEPPDRAGEAPRPPSLRGSGGSREQVAEELSRQKQLLQKLLEDARQTTEAAEAAEPLLSKQLYDTVRQTHQQRTDEALDATRQLVDRGFVDQAKAAAGEAGKGIGQLRERIEQAARGVLGDETESLKRARAELDALAQQLEREMARSGRADGPDGADSRAGAAGRPAAGGGDAVARSGNDNRERPGDPRGGPAARQRQGRDDAGTSGATTRPANPQLAQADAGQESQGRSSDGGRADPRQGRPEQDDGRPGQRGERQPRAGERRSGERGDAAQDAAGAGQAGSQADGQQPGQSQAGGTRGQRPGQPGEAGAAGGPGTPGESSRPGDSQQPGEGGSGRRQGDGREGAAPPDDAQAENARTGGQPNSRGSAGRGQGLRAQPDGQRPPGGQDQPGGSRPPGGSRNAGGQRPGDGGGEENTGTRVPEGPASTARGGDDADERGPFTGDNFRQWSDRLRDVEEMVGDPRLRAEAARIRERAKALRAETAAGEDGRHSKAPNWDVVRTTISSPLVELRKAVNEELRRRESSEALVPIDREPVPPAYAEQVRRYYERLGSGR